MRPASAVVRTEDRILKALKFLRDDGVVVMVDEEQRPVDILTSSDLEVVRGRAEAHGPDDSAGVLFSQDRGPVISVREGEELGTVVRNIATHGLPGIVVVDDDGHYKGYVFNADLQRKAESFIGDAEKQAEVVQRAYPEAWGATGAWPPSSAK